MKIKSKYPKSLFFGHWNSNSIRNKFESVQEIDQNTFDIFLPAKLKLIPPSQSSNAEYFERTVMQVVEDYFPM